MPSPVELFSPRFWRRVRGLWSVKGIPARSCPVKPMNGSIHAPGMEAQGRIIQHRRPIDARLFISHQFVSILQ